MPGSSRGAADRCAVHVCVGGIALTTESLVGLDSLDGVKYLR